MVANIFSNRLTNSGSGRGEVVLGGLPPAFYICLHCFFRGNGSGIPVLTQTEINLAPADFWMAIPGFDMLGVNARHTIWCFVPRHLRERSEGKCVLCCLYVNTSVISS